MCANRCSSNAIKSPDASRHRQKTFRMCRASAQGFQDCTTPCYSAGSAGPVRAWPSASAPQPAVAQTAAAAPEQHRSMRRCCSQMLQRKAPRIHTPTHIDKHPRTHMRTTRPSACTLCSLVPSRAGARRTTRTHKRRTTDGTSGRKKTRFWRLDCRQWRSGHQKEDGFCAWSNIAVKVGLTSPSEQ